MVFLSNLSIAIVLYLSLKCEGFVIQQQQQQQLQKQRYSKHSIVVGVSKPDSSVDYYSRLFGSTRMDDSTSNNSFKNHDGVFDRRSAMQQTSITLVSVLSLLSGSSSSATAATTITTDSSNLKNVVSAEHPIVVIGGGGKVGKLCTEMLATEGIYVSCATRSGRNVLGDDSLSEASRSFVKYVAADVNDSNSLEQACAGAYGVIFAASASGKKKGGDPAHVDYKGLYNTAKACLNNKVRKLVVVSSGTVTRPDSIGFKATNTFVKFIYGDRIMDYKAASEVLVRDLYNSNKDENLTYTIVRPGGLSDKSPEGSEKLHISQGDVYSSEVTRSDVAAVCIACLSSNDADNTTFELNQEDGLYKCIGSLPDLPTELIHTNKPTYVALLQGLKTDTEMLQQYPNIVSTFGGNGIEPLDKIV